MAKFYVSLANSQRLAYESQTSKHVCLIDIGRNLCEHFSSVNSHSERAFYSAFGRLLSESRRKKHVSQEMLADELDLSRTSITNIEKGRQPVQLYSLYLIARLLGIDVKDLLPSAADFNRPQHEAGLNVSRSEWLEIMNVMLDPKGAPDAQKRRTSSKIAKRE